MTDQVEEVKQKTDIVSIISERVTLKKAGRNYKGLCPFHQEKTPSFMVSPDLQIFKCFGCGESGDAISFLEKYEGMDFYEALKYLAEKTGVKLAPIKGKEFSEKEKFYHINELAERFYNFILLKHKAGREALHYLVHDRKIGKEAIDEFNLGFAPNIENALAKFLTQKKGVSIFDAEKAGLVVKSGPRVFDRFRGRIIFPLYDHRGNTIALAGRILPIHEKKELAKYINSPETPIYHKGSVLYGLNVTRSAIKKLGSAIVVEGEVDLISVWQAGVKNVVAIKGTALTENQLRTLSRFTNTLILALDSDIAGDSAARRGIAIAQSLGMQIKVLKNEKYKDPDDFVKADPVGFKNAVVNAIDVWEFIVDSIFKKNDATTADGKAKIGREIVPILSSMEDQIVQAHYIAKVAKRLDVPPEAVTSQMAKVAPQKEEPGRKPVYEESPKNQTRREILEERLVALGFQDGATRIDEFADLFQTQFAKRIFEEYEERSKKDKFILKDFVAVLPKELSTKFSELLLEVDREFEEDTGQLSRELELVVKELKTLSLKEKLSVLSRQISTLEDEGLEEKLTKATRKFSEISSELSKLEENNT